MVQRVLQVIGCQQQYLMLDIVGDELEHLQVERLLFGQAIAFRKAECFGNFGYFCPQKRLILEREYYIAEASRCGFQVFLQVAWDVL